MNMTNTITLTAKRIQNFVPDEDRRQSFLWDAKVSGLGVRMAQRGKPSYIFQSRYQKQTVRVTIGRVADWTIPRARERAREIQRQIDQGQDPRLVLDERKAAAKAKRKAVMDHSVTIGELWVEYVTARQSEWSEYTYKDHLKVMQSGGKERRRWKGKLTKAGPLAAMVNIAVGDVNRGVIERIARIESKRRPTQFRLALRMLKTFLKWLAETKQLNISADITTTTELKRLIQKAKPKTDHLRKEQLSVWFAAVTEIPNPIMSAYVRCLLLTASRRNELLNLKWDDIDWTWSSITIHDKVSGERSIPLTPYVRTLISNLPRRNEWVFSSSIGKTGHLISPSKAHTSACRSVDVHVTLHGLRRTFKSLTEWLDVPVGVVAQIMGHKPSATAERHYTIRPLDLLRIHHEKIESWILQEANVVFDPDQEIGKLTVIDGGISD